MQFLLSVIGIICLAIGLLWIGQGLGYIDWPASSFMINQKEWMYYGGGLSLVGLLIFWFARR